MLIWGFPKGGFCQGGNSIIGVVRAPVAIINFASNPCKNFCIYIGFNKEAPDQKNAKLIIATGVRPTPIIEILPLTKKKEPLETPKRIWAKRGWFVIFPVPWLLAYGNTALKSELFIAFGAHKKRSDNDTFRAVIPSIWISWDPQTLQNKGNSKWQMVPVFYRSTTPKLPFNSIVSITCNYFCRINFHNHGSNQLRKIISWNYFKQLWLWLLPAIALLVSRVGTGNYFRIFSGK